MKSFYRANSEDTLFKCDEIDFRTCCKQGKRKENEAL